MNRSWNRRVMLGWSLAATAAAAAAAPLAAGDQRGPNEPTGRSDDPVARRMDLMRSRAMAIKFRGPEEQLPGTVNATPLFRYDDIPRGYLDGAVWRWGDRGRPLAIITTELHPKYLGSDPRIVYDFLSLAPFPFSAISQDSSWRPAAAAVQFKPLPFADPRDAPGAADTPAKRRLLMRRVVSRFVATQIVSEEPPETKHLKLRLLPRPILTYQPDAGAAEGVAESTPRSGGESAEGSRGDAGVFLFVAGRMPGVILFLEPRGESWMFGIGRLSAPSTLTVAYDGQEVYRVPPNFGTWSGGYNASNSPITIPGNKAIEN